MLRLEEYFVGHTRAVGMFLDRFGVLRRQFRSEAEGAWDEETFTLHERFVYDDGEREQRTWRIGSVGEHGYESCADGVIGAARGLAYGNVLNWKYAFGLAVGTQIWTVRFDDWMFLQRDGVLINRAKVTKFGLRIGHPTCAFHKFQPSCERRPSQCV